MLNHCLLIIGLLLPAGCGSTPPPRHATPATIADQTFTYRGSPIHPGLIHEFEGRLSDGGPITLAVDVAASYGSDEYHDGDVIAEAGSSFAYRPSEREYYSYRWLGRLANGVHVVQTAYSGGGSGRFVSLLFLQMGTNLGFRPDGTPTERLVLSVFRWYPIGDRVDGPVRLDGNDVIIGPGPKIAEPTILRVVPPSVETRQ